MSNVLDDEKQQQIRALGLLGWAVSRIQRTTGSRRETVSVYAVFEPKSANLLRNLRKIADWLGGRESLPAFSETSIKTGFLAELAQNQ